MAGLRNTYIGFTLTGYAYTGSEVVLWTLLGCVKYARSFVNREDLAILVVVYCELDTALLTNRILRIGAWWVVKMTKLTRSGATAT